MFPTTLASSSLNNSDISSKFQPFVLGSINSHTRVSSGIRDHVDWIAYMEGVGNLDPPKF
jgi:hypothetical protein